MTEEKVIPDLNTDTEKRLAKARLTSVVPTVKHNSPRVEFYPPNRWWQPPEIIWGEEAACIAPEVCAFPIESDRKRSVVSDPIWH